jgi:hypothetical protein
LPGSTGAIGCPPAGLLFDRTAILCSEPPPRRHEAKAIGYQYSHAIVVGNSLWVTYAVTKGKHRTGPNTSDGACPAMNLAAARLDPNRQARRPASRSAIATARSVIVAMLAVGAAASAPAGPPGVVVDHVPASTGTYIGSPSLAILPDGSYVASHDLFGPASSEWRGAVTRVFRSTDRGSSWKPIATVEPAFWSGLFVHNGELYLMGTTHHHGRIVIRRSRDGGGTWSVPDSAATGLLTNSGEYHTAPMPVLVHAGRLWRAFEDAGGGTEWGKRYSAMMLSAPIDADLLDRRSWTFSAPLPRDAGWLEGRFGGWLEGNAVADADGRVLDILRVDTPAGGERAAIVAVSPDGRRMTFDPGTGFIDFPGGAKKFTIRRDPRTEAGGESPAWWTLATAVAPADAGRGNPASIRNTLLLMRSHDLRQWEPRSIVLHHPDVGKHAFQYVDWLFDGDDLVAVSRTAHDDDAGGAHRAHDANFLTFHRIKDFRRRSWGDSVVDPVTVGWPATGPEHRSADALLPAAAAHGRPNVLFWLNHGFHLGEYDLWAAFIASCLYAASMNQSRAEPPQPGQLTTAPHGHMLTNVGVWSPDSRWIVYDIRSAADGSSFDGTRIERVDVATGRVELLYESRRGACCGVVTASPVDDRVAFILGPEDPTADWSYGPARRRGVIVRGSRPGVAEPLDARDLAPPFTAGALRGGSHVHVFSPDGAALSFTYEDAVLDQAAAAGRPAEANLRGLGVSVCGRPTTVPPTHPRNHDGSAFTVAVTRLTDHPRPGSDEISRACEEAWIGTAGYVRADGTRQRWAIAFQGRVVTPAGAAISEVFVADLPADLADLASAGDAPLAGTETTRPAPPRGVTQRRLTFTADRRHPGIQGPRHWLRSSPDGDRIACLMRDDEGVVQLCIVPPTGGAIRQVTSGPAGIESCFTWTPDGRGIACVIDGCVCLVAVADGRVTRLTSPSEPGFGPRPEACVVSPDGGQIAFLRPVAAVGGRAWNQIFTVSVPEP